MTKERYLEIMENLNIKSEYDKLLKRYDVIVDECDMKRKRIEELEKIAKTFEEENKRSEIRMKELTVRWNKEHFID